MLVAFFLILRCFSSNYTKWPVLKILIFEILPLDSIIFTKTLWFWLTKQNVWCLGYNFKVSNTFVMTGEAKKFQRPCLDFKFVDFDDYFWCHIQNVLIGVKYRNCCQTVDVYLVFAILLGQIISKINQRLVTYKLASP